LLAFVGEFLKSLGLSGDEAGALVSVIGILLAIVIAVVPPARRACGRTARRAYLASSFPDWRYTRWFVRQHSTINNIYLDVQEDLDLAETYVPLAISGGDDTSVHVIATDVMSRNTGLHTIIVGEPGSGKSTLLRAFGVGIVRTGYRRSSPELRQIAATKQVPFLVNLTALGREGQSISIVGYLVRQVQKSGASRDPIMFLRRLMRQGRCLVLLDGLDEVAPDKYRAVRDEIHRFADGSGEEVPTGLCRIIMSCRRQNFMNMQDDWIPSFAGQSYMIMPFRDQEIVRYLEKRRSHFVVEGKTPQTFRNEINASDSADLHRTPLILAMSSGLYARTDFRVPSSIPMLFNAVITELLKRRNSKTFPVSHTLAFSHDDKRRFLNRFALEAARRRGFNDFTKQDLIRGATRMAEDLTRVEPSEVTEFVKEIIDRSGLIVSMSETTLGFAHRAIHEFLAASELSKNAAAGCDRLVTNAANDQWRQVAILFASMCEKPELDTFLPALADANLELAGHCLGVADLGTDVAGPIIGSLADQTDALDRYEDEDEETDALAISSLKVTLLSSLLAATRSPNLSTSRLATGTLQTILLGTRTGRAQDRSFLSGDATAAVQMVRGLAHSNNAEMAGLAVDVASSLPTDRRIVDPLWRCLNTAGVEEAAARKLVGRLLALAMSRVCFDELQVQPSYEGLSIPAQERSQCYPFDNGVDRSSNLVTLLVLAERYLVEPTVTGPRSSYFRAKADNPRAFRRLDWASRHTIQVPIAVRRGVLIGLAWICGVLSIAAGAWLLITDPSSLTRPYGAWNLLLAAAPVLASVLIAGVVNATTNLRSSTSEFMYELGCFGGMIRTVPELMMAASLLPMAGWSVPAYVAAGTTMSFFLFRLPATNFSTFRRTVYIPKLNPLLGLYDDPHCRHWLLRDADARRLVGPVRRAT
jgi:hypothetical protein